ncbi:MAG TPA: DUF2621 family protein [Candidatus Limnocylindria bacterium]|nr:DUF2621 family protein [Candidatus Limnocylindria bacterium]
MNWDEEARGILAQLCGMVPATFRELAEASAREESETLASERGGEEVEAADVVRGWIRMTPPEQRDALVPIIEDLGFDPVEFSDDLQSDEGWGEAEEPPSGK